MKSKVLKSIYFLIKAKVSDDERGGTREETKDNNYVGKKKETHNIVGLGTISLGVDLKLFHTVGDYPLCGLKKSSRFGHIAFRVFEGIDNQLFLNSF